MQQIDTLGKEIQFSTHILGFVQSPIAHNVEKLYNITTLLKNHIKSCEELLENCCIDDSQNINQQQQQRFNNIKENHKVINDELQQISHKFINHFTEYTFSKCGDGDQKPKRSESAENYSLYIGDGGSADNPYIDVIDRFTPNQMSKIHNYLAGQSQNQSCMIF